MSAPEPIAIRVWAAVLVNGQPTLQITDFPPDTRVMVVTDNPSVRGFRWSAIYGTERDEWDGDPKDWPCSTRSPCAPGSPCRKCLVAAVEWWFEWEERTNARKWRATNEHPVKERSGWSSSDWCSHGKGHADRAAAERCARRNSFARVVEVDGFGHRLTWVDLGAVQVSLLGAGQPSAPQNPRSACADSLHIPTEPGYAESAQTDRRDP